MTYAVHITRTAENDLSSAVDYLEHALLNPRAAQDLLDEAEEKISALARFPEKYPAVDEPVLKAWGVRLIAVKNYLVFCIVPEPEKRVYIVRFLFGRRDWATILRRGFSLA